MKQIILADAIRKHYISPMSMPYLDIDLLRTFLAVAEAGSFTGAAERVLRTQAAVSQQIARLENTLERKLFDRTTRSLALTGEGELLLGYARRMVNLNNEAVIHVTGAEASGMLRLGVCEDIIPRLLPQLLARFTAMHPRVELSLHTNLSSRLKEMLNKDELDLVIAKRDRASSLNGRVIWREPLVWFAARDYVVEEGADLPLVLLPQPCSYRELALQTLREANIPHRITCTSHSIMGLQAAVAGGLGVSVLGRSFVQDGLCELPPENLPELPQTEIAAFGESVASSTASQTLVDYLVDVLSEGEVSHRGACRVLS